MGRLPSSVGKSIAIKHAASIGSNIVKLPVISMISAIPSPGADNRREKRRHPNHRESFDRHVETQPEVVASSTEQQTKLGTDNKHRRKQPSRRTRGIRHGPRTKRTTMIASISSSGNT